MPIWIEYLAIYTLLVLLVRKTCLNQGLLSVSMMMLNVGCCYVCFLDDAQGRILMFIYTLLLLMQYSLIVCADRYNSEMVWQTVIVSPLIGLIIAKVQFETVPIAYSYLVFRLVYSAYETYSKKVTLPDLADYIAYIFFPLTFIVGPMSAYKSYIETNTIPYKKIAPYSRCLGRILVGLIKCYYLSLVFKGLSFDSYWLLNHYHSFAEFTVSAICTTLYIYMNFSGICDIFIGAAGIAGYKVDENFNNPFLARNLAEFWGRYHMTLTRIARDVIYTPLLTQSARYMSGVNLHIFNAVITIAIFTFIGFWHGNQIGFTIFGILHGFGIVIFHIYKHLSTQLPASVMSLQNGVAGRVFGTVITFLYMSYTTLFFGADWHRIIYILSHIRW